MREDWIECNLGELLSIDRGGSPRPIKEYITNDKNGINWIKIGDTKGISKYITKTGQKIKPSGLKKSRMVYPNDFILSNSMSFGRPYIMKTEGAIHDGWLVLRDTYNVLTKDFLYYALSSPIIYNQFSKLATGSTVKNLNIGLVEKVKIILRPIPEQRAISNKIETLFSDLDNGIANLKKAQEQLKIYRQAVLKKAFEGELTKEWREKQINLPTAKELLKQIKEERQKHYEKQIKDWKKAVEEWEKNSKIERKPTKPKALKEILPLVEDELKELQELPENWNWVKVDTIKGHNSYSIKAGPFGSSLKKSFYVKTGYKIYGQEQVIAGNHKIGDYYINEDKYQNLISCAVKPKDILISLVGTIGKVLILPAKIEEGIINPRLIKITLNDFYKQEFFKYYFESSYLKSLYAHKSHGATMDIITMGIIKELPFPLLSIPEQHQIIQEIETRLSVCDKVEQSITESLEKAKALRQSILKKAFEGKLLTKQEIEQCKQEEDYEPASVLLKKIKAEKENKEKERLALKKKNKAK